MIEREFGFSYVLPTTEWQAGKPLARSHGAIGGPQHNYVTIPIKAKEETDPDPQNPVSLNSGWSWLYGPTRNGIVTAHVRVMHVQTGGSLHLRLYKVRVNPDGTEVRLWGSESPERFVADGETHGTAPNLTFSSTHLDATWRLRPLAADERLRLEVDYWTAVNPDPYYEIGYIVGARIEGTYKREVEEEPPVSLVAMRAGNTPEHKAIAYPVTAAMKTGLDVVNPKYTGRQVSVSSGFPSAT